MTDISASTPARSSALHALLAPDRIAVIGASRRPSAIGHQIVHNIVSYGFTGAVYPVNPHAEAICSVPAYPTVTSVPVALDMAVIAVPSDHVVEIADECGRAGVKHLVVISAGFREAGVSGAERERALLEVVRRHGMRMVGPNCMGIVNVDPAVSLNATFATAMPPFGGAAFVSQSGALGLSVLDSAREYGMGMAQFVSIGNKTDVSGNDLLEYWEHDPSVRVILMYVESFGNPTRFLELARRITKSKPIIVVKSGRSDAGAKAASSHTGALAASDSAVDAMLTQAGVLRAPSIEALFDMAMAFEARALPRSRRTAILTNAGGPGILAADAMDASGLQLAELSPVTVERLRPLLPSEASLRNPLDMIASATPAGYRAAMEALLADPGIDAVVPIFVPPFGVKQEDIADAIVGAKNEHAKPVVAVLMGREGLPYGRETLHAAGIPTYIFPESAARALAALNRHVEWCARPAPIRRPLVGIDRAAACAVVAQARAAGREHLTPVEALALVRAYGIAVPRSELVTSQDAAAACAASIGYPVVLKIASRDIIHKSDVGGVRVGIGSEEALRDAYTNMVTQVAALAPEARIEGVVIQGEAASGVETIIGMTRDPLYGPLVMFGLGGVFVEALRDVAFRLAPVDDAEALDMMRAIRGARLLDGFRGAPATDQPALADVIQRIGQLGVDFPAISAVDLNPVIALARGVIAVDVRVRLCPTQEEHHDDDDHAPRRAQRTAARRFGVV